MEKVELFFEYDLKEHFNSLVYGYFFFS